MKSNEELKNKAVKLRVKGRRSFNEINAELGVPRSTLSVWLKDYPLTAREIVVRNSVKASRQNRERKVVRDATRPEKSKWLSTVQKYALTRKDKARIAEAAVIFRLVVHGIEVYQSVFDGDKADVVVRTDAGFKTIQVKWARKTTSGDRIVPLSCVEGHNSARRYKKGEFDFIAGYDVDTDIVYVFSERDVAHLGTNVTVKPDAAERWDKLRL